MSNEERDPQEVVGEPMHDAKDVLVLAPREVPLGGPRAMTVRRTLPHRDRSFVGAWCFVDHYGPDDVAATGGMHVPPHPHTALQTVTWLFEGQVEHHDSGGYHAIVRPGEVNLMTAGQGIAHSEVSTDDTQRLHGVQLWVVLPEADRDLPRRLQHFAAPESALGEGVHGRVFVGSLAGAESPIETATPLLAAEIRLEPGSDWQVEVDPGFEHAVLLDDGDVTLEGAALESGALAVTDPGRASLHLTSEQGARIVLLGGEPYDEEIVMWWNFIGRNHDEVAAYRAEWEAGSDRFGDVPGYDGGRDRLPAPALPNGPLRSRRREGPTLVE
ncbi:pirin family protein [Barrientosiimonas humi]|uniref:pirin family protein n=1 Tax=Barrientosiimonas humi TaxID=999931 RepID=UPI00370D2609